jgi:hypothetical protein
MAHGGKPKKGDGKLLKRQQGSDRRIILAVGRQFYKGTFYFLIISNA